MKDKKFCKIVEDLLPNYMEKMTTEETNRFIEEHVQECQECKNKLNNMNENVELGKVDDREIDYLKKYRNKKIKSIIFAVLLTIIILFNIYIALRIYDKYVEIFIDVDTIYIANSQKEKANGKEILTFFLCHEKYNLQLSQYEKIEDDGNKIIYFKVVGKYPFTSKVNRTYYSFDIDENTEKIYMEDKDGNLKEIWNKEVGILTEISKTMLVAKEDSTTEKENLLAEKQEFMNMDYTENETIYSLEKDVELQNKLLDKQLENQEIQEKIEKVINKFYKEEYYKIKQEAINTDGIKDGTLNPNGPEIKLYNLIINIIETKEINAEESEMLKEFLSDSSHNIKGNDELKLKMQKIGQN